MIEQVGIDCVGCAACEQKCPASCIKMISNEEGFLYSFIDKGKCIHCNQCEKVCPQIAGTAPEKSIVGKMGIWGTKLHNPDQDVMRSASAGVFFRLAVSAVEMGGGSLRSCIGSG